MGEAMGNLAEDEGEVFGAGAEQHADEDSVGLDGGVVERGPGYVDDGFDERRVRAFETRDNVREGENPETQLGELSSVGCCELEVELVHELVKRPRDALDGCQGDGG